MREKIHDARVRRECGGHGQPGSYFGEDGYGHMKPNRRRVAVPGLEKYQATLFCPKPSRLKRNNRAIEFLFVPVPLAIDPRFAGYSDPSGAGSLREQDFFLLVGLTLWRTRRLHPLGGRCSLPFMQPGHQAKALFFMNHRSFPQQNTNFPIWPAPPFHVVDLSRHSCPGVPMLLWVL